MLFVVDLCVFPFQILSFSIEILNLALISSTGIIIPGNQLLSLKWWMKWCCVQNERIVHSKLSSLQKKFSNDGLVCLALLKETHDLLWPFQLSLSLFSCYETLQLKPRLPQFITGGTKAKALDKAGQANSNQLPLNTHITPLSALLTYKWPIQDFFFFPFFFNLSFYVDRDIQMKKTPMMHSRKSKPRSDFY